MPRPSRNFPGGLVYHVLNRGVGRRMLFDKGGDFLAFEKVIEETLRTCRMRICAFCILSNHWHVVVWPESDGDLSAFMQQITNMHVKRWKEHRHEVGYGHLYQGRYKCFPVETAGYFYQVVRYVERNALRGEFGGSCRGLALVEPEARGTGRPSVSNPLRLAAAPALRLAPNRQPTAVRSRTGCAPTSGSSRLSLRQRRLDRRDREATQNRFDTTSSRKAEEGKINAARSNISPLYIAYYPNSVAGTFSFPVLMTSPCGWEQPKILPISMISTTLSDHRKIT